MGRLDKPKSHAAHCALVIVGRQNASAKVHFKDSPLGRTDQDRVENGDPTTTTEVETAKHLCTTEG